MDEEPMLPGRQYLMRIGNHWTPCSITSIRHGVNVNTLEHEAARQVALNGIALCNISTAKPCAFDPYEENRSTGAFILVDRFTNQTAGAGMVTHALRRATNIHHEGFLVSKESRAALLHQKPAILWFTGLSGSGKSTVAKLLEQELLKLGRLTMTLDGDNIRHGLNKDLGFTDADRVENVRRIGEVSKLFVETGVIVLCSFISPFRAERQMVRELVEPGEFIEVFVDTPIEECIARDPKGLYAKAKSGAIPNFTGIDSPYEAPENPEIVLKTVGTTPEVLAKQIIDRLREMGHPI
jgi:bifunctional enzyme CysN/CysC